MFTALTIPKLLILLALVVLIFGTKKLPALGADLGSAIANFKKSLSGNAKSGEVSRLTE